MMQTTSVLTGTAPVLQFAAVPQNKATLLLAFRPYGLDYIKAQASGFSLAGELVREVKLEPLTLEEATRLALANARKMNHNRHNTDDQ